MTSLPKPKKRLVTVVIRGCTFKLPPKEADKFNRLEKKLLATEANNNQLID